MATKRRKLFPTTTRRGIRKAAVQAARAATKAYATPIVKDVLDGKISTATINEIGTLVQETCEKLKTPTGVKGHNLNKDKMQLLSGTAVGDTTETTCVFSYRPKKTRKMEDTIFYEAVRNKSFTFTTTAGKQYVADRNLALLEPPGGDDISTDTSYTNFSIRNEFDRMFQARLVQNTGGSTYAKDQLEQNMIANFHQLHSTMIIKAPTSGAIVEIYDLQPQFGIGPGTKQNEFQADDHISPQWCMKNGFANNVGSLQTQAGYDFNVVGADPMDSSTFRRTYNVIKKTTVRMTKDSVHRHRLVFGINKSVTWDEMGQASPNGGTAPWLPTQMVIARGYPNSGSLAESVELTIQQESMLKYSSRVGANTQVIVYNNNT